MKTGTSLGVLWLRTPLPLQRARVQFLVRHQDLPLGEAKINRNACKYSFQEKKKGIWVDQKKKKNSIHSTFDQAASSTEMPFLTARPTQPFESSSEIIASKQSS